MNISVNIGIVKTIVKFLTSLRQHDLRQKEQWLCFAGYETQQGMVTH